MVNIIREDLFQGGAGFTNPGQGAWMETLYPYYKCVANRSLPCSKRSGQS